MARTVHALMVGIDAYRSPVTPLRGCVNDIRALEASLRQRLASSDWQFNPLLLLDGHAKRQALIDAFASHLGQAGPDDVALFAYAGHGSQQRTPPAFWHLEPDRLDETLVCIDSRDPGQYDLADKELAKLIAGIAGRGAHVLVILDACHSGSGTRDLSAAGVRRIATDPRERPLASLLVTPDEVAALQAGAHGAGEGQGEGNPWLRLPQGRHIVMSACQDIEEARELRVEDRVHGVFTHALLEALADMPPRTRYRDLFKRVNALVRLRVAGQSPVIAATDPRELERPFLGLDGADARVHYTASFDRAAGWVLDAGAMHGIAPPVGAETTQLAVFAPGTIGAALDELEQAVGEAEVLATDPGRSRLKLTLRDGSAPDPNQTYPARLTALPLPPCHVRLDGDATALAPLREALRTAADGAPSLLVAEAADGAELVVSAGTSGWRVRRAADERALFVDVPLTQPEAARQVVARLEHMARWLRIATLANPAARLPASAVHLDIHAVDENDQALADALPAAALANGLRLDYTLRDGEWAPTAFKLKLVNTTGRRLFCMLLDLNAEFAVWPGLLAGAGLWLDAGQEAWAFDGEPIVATVPDNLWSQGVCEVSDLLKLVVSTEECDATLLQQDALDLRFEPAASRLTRGLSDRQSTLERLMNRVQTRALGARPKPQDKLADWVTSEVWLHIGRPLPSVAVPAPGQVATVSGTVSVHGHAVLRARARLATAALAARNAAFPPLPPLLIDDPQRVQPFELSDSRAGEPGVSMLELQLDDAAAFEAVTPQAPLLIDLARPLAEGEHVLPLGHDGEFFLPLGHAQRRGDGVRVVLDRLPPPVSARSLGSAVRILFQKVTAPIFGGPYPYPLLAAVEADGRRSTDTAALRARVAQAQRIVVYVHGIIGDTRGMAASAFARPAGVPAGAPGHDLVLAFDYENLKTPIEQTARDLKQRLADIGLGAGHGKRLHLVAHSMGGLVSRWFIEHEGGHAVVSRLVMLGTPNGGSPWSTVEDWASTALTLGLNGLAPAIWPAAALGALALAIEHADDTLEQMQPASPLLATLAASADPGIGYRVIAGNTSILRDASAEGAGRIARLLERLSARRLLHGAAGLAFFGQPNDIASSVASIGALPPHPAQDLQVREVACDHLSYFNSEAGLCALAEALA